MDDEPNYDDEFEEEDEAVDSEPYEPDAAVKERQAEASAKDVSAHANLAQATLEGLANAGARVVTTTHYNLLKEMAEVDDILR